LDGTSQHTSETLLAAPVDDDERSDRDAVAEVIGEVLAGGPCPREDVIRAIRAPGSPSAKDLSAYVPSTRRRAQAQRVRFGSDIHVLATERRMVDKSDKAPVTQDAVHYVQNEPDQDYRDDATHMVEHSGHAK